MSQRLAAAYLDIREQIGKQAANTRTEALGLTCRSGAKHNAGAAVIGRRYRRESAD